MTAYPPPPPWAPWWYGNRGRTGVANPDLRVSDAERSEVADLLTKHFAEGRLDQIELDERLQRTMSARTRGELSGVLDDLPPLGAEAAAAPAVEYRRRRGTFSLLLVTMLIFLAAFSAAAWTWHFPWLLFAVIFFVFWRRSRWGWHRHSMWHGHGPGAGGPGYPGAGPWWMGPRRRGWWV